MSELLRFCEIDHADFYRRYEKTSVNITLRRALIMDAKWPIKTKLDHSTHNEMALTKKCLVDNTPDCYTEQHQRDTSNMNKL